MPPNKRTIPKSDCNEEVPVKIMKKDNGLCENGGEKCIFCNELFDNKYQILVHNMKHIIVPVTKATYYKCQLCYHYFTSKYKLKKHLNHKHKPKNENAVNINMNITNAASDQDENKIKIDVHNEYNDPKKDIETKLNELKNAILEDVSNDNIQVVIDDKKQFLINNDENFNDNDLNDDDECIIIEDNDDPTIKNGNITNIPDRVKNELINNKIVKPEKELRLSQILLAKPIVVLEDISAILRMRKDSHDLNEINHDPTTEVNHKQNERKEFKDKIPTEPINTQVEHQNEPFEGFLTRKPLVYCDNTVTKLLEMKSIGKKPVILCDTSLKKSLEKNLTTEKPNDYSETLAQKRCPLKFEDEDDIISLSSDSSDTNKINIPKATIQGKIMLGTIVPVSYTPSIHYDELIQPGLYRCNKCGSSFPNRYQCLMHQTYHLKIKKRFPPYPKCPFCCRYIVGNYRTMDRHLKTIHNYEGNRVDLPKRGPKKYQKDLHTCEVCNKKFKEEDLIEHSQNCTLVDTEFHGIKKSIKKKMLQVCELCFMFLKDRQNTKYVFVRDVSEVGLRQKCQRCEKEFFEVKLVEVIRTHLEDYTDTAKKMKPVSNEGRLKNIQHRLKMFNKLSRF